jgi:diaminopimelate epimerase
VEPASREGIAADRVESAVPYTVNEVMKFHKYQALGNDYLVVDWPASKPVDTALVRRICDRNFGVGSDGILVGARLSADKFDLRIFNPDGSEAEKSGNGLRIFARYLWDSELVQDSYFIVATKGGDVVCQVRDSGRNVFVEMGRASFDSSVIPVNGPPHREVIGETLDIGGEQLRFTALTVGNPHCVIHRDEISASLARRLGPLIETHALFPNRTNVQFVKVLESHRIQIEIWERGAGYTLASGSSSCAAAAASVKLGYCSGDVTVSMPGGTLQIGVKPDFSIDMLGPVEKVAEGTLAPELLESTRAV